MFGGLGFASRPLGVGAMRLSTDPGRDEERGVSVLHAAFDAGARLVDTADVYGLGPGDIGHNERLLARALETWPGDRAAVKVATKGGLTRPPGRWVPKGTARHLAAACEASRRALGVDRIFLYLLHAPDPRTPFATSVRALAALRREGLVEHVGLSNVTVGQIEEARRIVDIAAVEVELSLLRPDHLRSGVVAYCAAHGIPLLAHRPLGGPEGKRRLLADPLLRQVAAAAAATPLEIALAWLLDLGPLVVPLPGVSRVETARALGRPRDIGLTAEAREGLDARFPAGRRLRPGSGPAANDGKGEVVLVMGLPGAGKSTIAEGLVAQGYARLNRDQAGGRLVALLPKLDRLIRSGETRVVLDNTYVTRKTRAEVVERAWASGFPVRCLFASTGLEDAQINAAQRLVRRHGRLLEPEEMKDHPDDPGAFGPGAQFRYARQLEPPDPSEGFSSIEVVRFERRRDPSYVNRALIFGTEGVVLRSRSGLPRPCLPDDLTIPSGRREAVAGAQEAGFLTFVLSWRPEIAEGSARREDILASFERASELLGGSVEFHVCPHGGGPPACWCRKPLPGLLVLLVERHRLDPGACWYVSEGRAERRLAERVGFRYLEAGELFAPRGAERWLASSRGRERS